MKKKSEKPNAVQKIYGAECVICTNFVHARGLCNTCYFAAREMVRGRKITWKELEAQNLSKPLNLKQGLFRRAFNEKFLKDLSKQ